MTTEPIYVDLSKTAELNHGAITDQFLTLEEAIAALNQLPAERKETASIITGGKVYASGEIARFTCAKKDKF